MEDACLSFSSSSSSSVLATSGGGGGGGGPRARAEADEEGDSEVEEEEEKEEEGVGGRAMGGKRSRRFAVFSEEHQKTRNDREMTKNGHPGEQERKKPRRKEGGRTEQS